MTMTVVFESYAEMRDFAEMVMGPAPSGKDTSQRPTAEGILGITPETFVAAPIAPPPVLQAPVTPPPMQQAPVTPPVQEPAQQAPAAQPVQSVPTTAPSYTLDDLTRAAIPLMDSGKQPELLQLIRSFGVDAMPSLPQAQYGAFATALRGLGAQI